MTVFEDQETLRLHSIMGEDDESSTGTYAQMVEEVEKVSELLQETRETLRSTQDRLEESEHKSEMLEMKLRAEEQELELMNRENEMLNNQENLLREEVQRLQMELQRPTRPSHPSNPSSEVRWKKAVEFLNQDLLDTKEALERTKIELATQRSTCDQLERINVQLRNRNNRLVGTGGASSLHQHELKEAQMQASDLLEENSKLRQQLELEKKTTEDLKKLVENLKKEQANIKLDENAKEKIRFEEREKTTKALTLKLRKEISSEVNAKKEREVTILREQLKRAFSDKEALEEKIRRQEEAVKETEKLRQEISRSEFEVSRLHEVIERTREESEAAINELESKFRKQVHAMQEQQAREKWAKISEMRQQVYQEREHELIDYQNRMQSLTEETSRLLEQAEIDKERYGREIQHSIESMKQEEIDAMNNELTHYRREVDALRRTVDQERELLRQEYHDRWEEEVRSMETEKETEVQSLLTQVKSLEGQCDSLQEEAEEMIKEIKSLRKEKKAAVGKLKQSEMNFKAAKGEISNLKLRNETLRKSIQEYEKVVDARDEEIRKTNDLLQRHKVNGSPRLKDHETIHLNGRVEALSLTVQKYKQERAHLIDQLTKTKQWANGLGTDSKDYFYFLWTAELSKLERVLKRYDSPSLESKNSLDQPDDEATMDKQSTLRDELLKNALEEADSLCPPPDTPASGETSESMKEELQAARDAVFRLKAEVQKLGAALVIANGTPPTSPQGTKDISEDENAGVRQVDMNVEEVISELEDFFATLDASEEKSSQHEHLFEGLLGAAARESLKICKRIHESDQRCRFLLSQVGPERRISSKHATIAESSRQENVRISREFQGTLKQLRETLKSWKLHKSGVKNQLDVIKTKLGMHRKRDNDTLGSTIEVRNIISDSESGAREPETRNTEVENVITDSSSVIADPKGNKPQANKDVEKVNSDSASRIPEALVTPKEIEAKEIPSFDESEIDVPSDETDDNVDIADEETVHMQKVSQPGSLEMADQSWDSFEQNLEDTREWDVRDDASCESVPTENADSDTPNTTPAHLHLSNRTSVPRKFWQETSTDTALQNANSQQEKLTIAISAAPSTDDASDDSVLDTILCDTPKNELREAIVVTTVYSEETFDSKPFDC